MPGIIKNYVENKDINALTPVYGSKILNDVYGWKITEHIVGQEFSALLN